MNLLKFQNLKKIEVDLTALEAHEQAELTERLSDYYSPDDVELQPAPNLKLSPRE